MNCSNNLKKYPVSESEYVINEFEHNKFSNQAYEELIRVYAED